MHCLMKQDEQKNLNNGERRKYMNRNIKRISCLIFAALIICAILLMFTGCASNRQFFDTTYSFDEAVIRLPNDKVIEGKVESWKDYENSDQIQIKIDGKTYLVHSANCVLINSGEKK